MINNNSINKTIYISNNSVALVVFNKVNNENNILFANQVNTDYVNLKVKLNELLTNAANFLGFNIKQANVIFKDTDLSNIDYYHQTFANCTSIDDVKKEIYKKAKIDNYYVNDIVFETINFNDFDRSATATYKICACNYMTYKKLINIVKQCNVIVNNTANIFGMLNQSTKGKELVIDFVDNKNVACQYLDGKLVACHDLDINFNTIKLALGLKYDLSISQIDQILSVAKVITCDETKDINLAIKFDIANNSIEEIKAANFIYDWQSQLYNQIFKQVDFADYTNVNIISKFKINAIGNFNILNSNVIGLDTLALDNAICLNNIDKLSKLDNHYSFENRISKAIEELPA